MHTSCIRRVFCLRFFGCGLNEGHAPRRRGACAIATAEIFDPFCIFGDSRVLRHAQSLKRRLPATDEVSRRSMPLTRTRGMPLAARERRAARLLRIRRAAMPDRKNSKASDYVVGYRRPPKASQFMAGKSGNPKGRPKGSRSIGAVLQVIIRQKIAVTKNGKTRRIPVIEVMLRARPGS